MKESTKLWWKAAGVRAIKTAAQIGLILIGSDMLNIVTLDWPYILGCMATGVVVSMLTSVAGIPEANDGESPIAKHAK